MATKSNPHYPSTFTPVLERLTTQLIIYMHEGNYNFTPMMLDDTPSIRACTRESVKDYLNFRSSLKVQQEHDILAELLEPIDDDYTNIIEWFKNFQKKSGKLFCVRKSFDHFYLYIDKQKMKQYNLHYVEEIQKELTGGASEKSSISFRDRYSYDSICSDMNGGFKSVIPVQTPPKHSKHEPSRQSFSPHVNSPPGNPRPGNPPSGNPHEGNPYPGNPYPGNPYPGNPYQGNPHEGNPWKYYHPWPMPNRINIALKINKMYESGLLNFHVTTELLSEL